MTTPTNSSTRARVGIAISVLAVLFLLFDSGIKLANTSQVVDAMQKLGYPTAFDRGLGVLELLCVIVYLVPRTAIVGAVLLTGYLGGAIASHLRVADPWLGFTQFPLYVAVLYWGGLYLRDSRVKLLLGRRPER